MRPTLLLVLALAGGCATTGAAARQFTGDPYSVKDEGDRVTGLVCGVAVDYTVDKSGDRTVLGGFGRPVHLEVTHEGAARHIVGTLGTRVGADEVDLVLTPDALSGRAGLRDFQLAMQDDQLRGAMSTLHVEGSVRATVDGRSELVAMPDGPLAAVLPSLLNCDRSFTPGLLQPELHVRVGGAASYEPRENNSER